MRYGHFIMAILCAWVLWGYQIDTPVENMKRTRFNLKEAYETNARCESERYGRNRMERAADEGEAEQGGKIKAQYFITCLPDTIDPRAPK